MKPEVDKNEQINSLFDNWKEIYLEKPKPKESSFDALKFFGAFAFFWFAFFFGTIYGGWVLHILWQWFIVPLGVQALSVKQAIGVGIVTSFFTYSLAINLSRVKTIVKEQQTGEKESGYAWIGEMIKGWIYLTIAFGIAAIWHLILQ